MKNILLTLIFSLLIISCSKTRFDDHDHSHSDDSHNHDSHSHNESELENYRITEFSNHYEIFAEVNPFIVGEQSQLIIHYTRLSDFKPLTNGQLNIILSGSINAQIQIDSVARAGIFIAEYIPQTSGKFDMLFVLNDGNLIDTIIAKDMQSFATKEEAKANEQKAEDGISFLKEEAWKIDFGLEKIVPIEFSNVLKSTGKVLFNPNDEVNITAGSSGIIEFVDNSLIVGKQIANGTKIFTIIPSSTRDDNYSVRFEQAKAEFNKANREFTRISELYKLKITTEREYLEAKTNFESADAIFKNYSSYSDGKSQLIKAPKSGLITKLFVNPGQFIEAGSPIAIISNSNKLMIQAELPTNELHILGKISNINLEYNGTTIDLINLGLNQIGEPIAVYNSNFSKINFQFDNKLNIMPNANYTIFLKGYLSTNSLTVPKESIWEDRGHFYVFVRKHGELFEKREVLINGFDGNRYAIQSGLNVGEVVVTKGSYRVMLASRTSELPEHGHTH